MSTPNQKRNIVLKPTGGFSKEALAWRKAIVANSGTISDTVLKKFDEKYFKPMVRSGLFAKFDRLCIYAGTGNENASRTNTIKDAHHATRVGTPGPTYDSTQGYVSASSGYLNLNYTPSTQAVALTLTSSTVFIVVKNPVYNATPIRGISARSAGPPATRLGIYRDNNGPYALNNSTSGLYNSNKPTAGNVFIAGVLLSGTHTCYANATTATQSLTATALPTTSSFELTESLDGSPQGFYDTNYHLASGHGAGLTSTEVTTLQSILTDLWTALGV